MSERGEERHRVEPGDNVPRVWVFTLNYQVPGRPLYRAQSIGEAIEYLMRDPSVGIVLPFIPGMAYKDVQQSEDISTIGDRRGMLVTGPPTITNGAIEALLLAQEKLRVLGEKSLASPELITQVLGIYDNSVFDDVARRIRKLRHKIAHPSASRISGDPDLSLFLDYDKEYARRALEWNGLSCPRPQ